jgi:hypothetical protein
VISTLRRFSLTRVFSFNLLKYGACNYKNTSIAIRLSSPNILFYLTRSHESARNTLRYRPTPTLTPLQQYLFHHCMNLTASTVNCHQLRMAKNKDHAANKNKDHAAKKNKDHAANKNKDHAAKKDNSTSGVGSEYLFSLFIILCLYYSGLTILM